MTAPTYESALREAYGDPDDFEHEAYGRPRRRPAKPRRVRCECGVNVYAASRDDGPPALPAACWRCLEPLSLP